MTPSVCKNIYFMKYYISQFVVIQYQLEIFLKDYISILEKMVITLSNCYSYLVLNRFRILYIFGP